MVYEALRMYPLNAHERPYWKELPACIKQSLVNLVAQIKLKLICNPEGVHLAWCEEYLERGWSHGKEFSLEYKKHPSLVRFKDLPRSEQLKDEIAYNMIHFLLSLEHG